MTQTVLLGDVSDLKYGKMPTKSRVKESGAYPIFTGYRIAGYYDEFNCDEKLIVVARGVGGTGDVKISPPKSFLTNLSILVDLDENVASKEYLYYYLNAGLKYLDTGSAQAQITISDLKRLKVLLPDIEQQRKIVNFFLKLDQKIELNRRMNETLEQMGQALFKRWFIDFEFPTKDGSYKTSGGKMKDSPLGLIPVEWMVYKLEDATDLVIRGITPIYDEDSPCLVINQKCIRGGRLNIELARRQSKPIPVARIVERGDVLVNSTGVGTLGRVAQVPYELQRTTVDSHVTIVRAHPGINKDWFGQLMLGKESELEGLAKGTTGQTELSREAISSVPFVFPTHDLMDKFGAISHGLRQFITDNELMSENLITLRDSLLPRLLSGNIKV